MENVKKVGFFRSVADLFEAFFGNGVENEIVGNEKAELERSKYFLAESHDVKEGLRAALDKVKKFESKYASKGTPSKAERVTKKANVPEQKAPQNEKTVEREIGD